MIQVFSRCGLTPVRKRRPLSLPRRTVDARAQDSFAKVPWVQHPKFGIEHVAFGFSCGPFCRTFSRHRQMHPMLEAGDLEWCIILHSSTLV